MSFVTAQSRITTRQSSTFDHGSLAAFWAVGQFGAAKHRYRMRDPESWSWAAQDSGIYRHYRRDPINFGHRRY